MLYLSHLCSFFNFPETSKNLSEKEIKKTRFINKQRILEINTKNRICKGNLTINS